MVALCWLASLSLILVSASAFVVPQMRTAGRGGLAEGGFSAAGVVPTSRTALRSSVTASPGDAGKPFTALSRRVGKALFDDGAPQKGGVIVLFDGTCHFCSGGVWFMIRNSEDGQLFFVPQESDPGMTLLEEYNQSPDSLDSIAVIVEPGRLLTRSDAVLEILRRMTGPWPALAFAINALPLPVREDLYTWVSANRHIFGIDDGDTCRIPEDDELSRFVLEVPLGENEPAAAQDFVQT
jgi:predicted DCC family thiol-disulfide oxidoreductase YuxK